VLCPGGISTWLPTLVRLLGTAWSGLPRPSGPEGLLAAQPAHAVL